MGQFSTVLLATDKVHTVPQRALDGRPGLGGLNQVYGPEHPSTIHTVLRIIAPPPPPPLASPFIALDN